MVFCVSSPTCLTLLPSFVFGAIMSSCGKSDSHAGLAVAQTSWDSRNWSSIIFRSSLSRRPSATRKSQAPLVLRTIYLWQQKWHDQRAIMSRLEIFLPTLLPDVLPIFLHTLQRSLTQAFLRFFANPKHYLLLISMFSIRIISGMDASHINRY